MKGLSGKIILFIVLRNVYYYTKFKTECKNKIFIKIILFEPRHWVMIRDVIGSKISDVIS